MSDNLPMSQVVVYLLPNNTDMIGSIEEGMTALSGGAAIGVWVRREDSWQIRISIPVAVSVLPVHLGPIH